MRIIRRSSEAFWDVVDESLIVCHEGTGRMCSLNSTAEILWQHCDGRSLDDLVDVLSAAYPEHTHDEVLDDTHRLIASLVDRGFLAEEDR